MTNLSITRPKKPTMTWIMKGIKESEKLGKSKRLQLLTELEKISGRELYLKSLNRYNFLKWNTDTIEDEEKDPYEIDMGISKKKKRYSKLSITEIYHQNGIRLGKRQTIYIHELN